MRAVNLLPGDEQRTRLGDKRAPVLVGAGGVAVVTICAFLLAHSASSGLGGKRAELARYHATEIGPVAWDQTVHPPTDAADLVRASVPPWREREVAIGDAIAYLGTGIVFLLGERSDDDLRALRERCERMGGALVLERADPSRKRSLGAWGTPRNAPRIAQALKARFDPKGVLAPGRLPA